VLGLARLLLADQVTLTNGDRVTGAVVRKDGTTLTVKSEIFGTVTIPWAKVQSIRTDKPVTVVVDGGKSLQGKVEPAGDQLQISSQESPQPIPLNAVVALRDADEQRTYERLLRPAWTQLWAGTATFGFAGTQGNARTRTLTIGANAARITRRDKTTVYFNAIRAAAVIDGLAATTAQAVRGGWAYSHNVSPKLFVNTFNDYELDRFQRLDLRFVLGGGMGYGVWKGERGRLELQLGAAYNREKFSPLPPRVPFSRNAAEGYWGNEFSFKLNGTTSLYQNFRMFNNLTNTGEYRVNADIGVNTRLTKWLNWNVALSNRYLSNPVQGRVTNDFLYTTGLGVTFARQQ
jgi:putative salt-induced outer membrane protein YdiY